MKKKIITVLLVGCMLCQNIGMLQARTLVIDGKKVEYNTDPISLYVNKKLVETKVMEPVQINNRVLVPTREVFEAMGATVQWDNTLKQVTVQYESKKIVLVVNKTTATINGTSVTMDVPGKIINDKVMIPVRFVSEGIGMSVQWDSGNKAVWIEEPKNSSNSNGTTEQTLQIKQVTTKESNNQFVATVTGSSAIGDIKVSKLTDKVIIDIVDSKCLLSSSITPVDNTYVKGIRTSQFTTDTTRIVLDLKMSASGVDVETSFSSDRKSLNITLKNNGTSSGTTVPDDSNNNNNNDDNNNNSSSSGTTTSSALYVAGSKPVLNLAGVTSSKIKVTDDYRNKTLVFDLDGDYSKTLPNTELKPNDSYVSSISIKTTNGVTKVTVVTKTIYTYELSQADNRAVVTLMRPTAKYDQIVVIDIGHGGSDAGAVGNGFTEKQINFDQGMALYRLLEADPNIKVYMTRETDVYPTLQFRAQLANEIEADLFVSIHNNSASPTVRGAETLYFPSATDTRGKAIAQLVQDSIVACGMKNRGIKARSDLYVLKNTNMTAILLETGFISNAEDAALISSSSFIQKWAKGVYGAIVEGFKLL